MIKYAILGLLHYKNMHGYRIKKHIEQNFGHMWSINYGQIYPNLKKLEQDGLIRMTQILQNDEKGPPRKLYSITEKGKKDFAAWLHASPEKSMLLRDPFLMRFVFFGFGDPERALELIDEQIALYEQQMERRRRNLKKWKKSGGYVRLMGELGVSLNEMFLQWLNRARSEILKDKTGETSHPSGTQKRSIAR